jgi:hypothetical protein
VNISKTDSERHYTAQEWILMGLERTFASEEEESEYFGRCPIPVGDAAPAIEQPVQSTVPTEPVTIRWAPPTPVSAGGGPAAPASSEPAQESPPAEEPVTIRWRSAALV